MAASLFLTAATGVNCDKTAGVRELYVAPKSAIETITYGSDHDITDILFETATEGFGKVNFKRGECEVTENMERFNEVVVNFAVPNPTSTQRKELQAIRDTCEMVLVARLYDSDRLLFIGADEDYGDDAFAAFQVAESTSGRAKTDDNLFSFSIRAEQGEFLRVLSGLSTVSATTVADIIAELVAATNA